MRKNGRKILASGFLLMILAAYAFCLSCFSHTHFINGVMIVHSHPFDKDTSHTHTKGQVLTIDQLSHVNLLPAELITIVQPIISPAVEINYDSRLTSLAEKTLPFASLRAPPKYS